MGDDLTAAGLVFTDPRAYADEDRWHRAAALLRERDPIHRVEAPGFRPFYALTRHADVREIERQPDRFLNTLESVLIPQAEADEQIKSGIELKTLIHMDGAEHRAARTITHEWFKPISLRRRMEDRIGVLAREYVDRMLAYGDRCDFARDIALYYPLHVIMGILGLPKEDEARMLRLTQQLFGNEDPEFAGDNRAEAIIGAMIEFAGYFEEITQDRRRNPGPDLASTIANGTIDGNALGPLETASYYTIVATAGHDTTSSSLATGLQKLMENPDQIRLLKENPDRIPNAVDEILRWSSPVRHFLRYATEDYQLGGVTIREGERVLLSYLSANRDEEVFEDAFRFDVSRSNAHEHLAFGIGVHYCLGAHLARMELIAFYQELFSRVESIEPDGEAEYTLATFVGGPKRLPVRFRAAAS